MIGREGLETLLALVWLHLAAMGTNGFSSMHLHRGFVHEDLYRAKIICHLNYKCFFYCNLRLSVYIDLIFFVYVYCMLPEMYSFTPRGKLKNPQSVPSY